MFGKLLDPLRLLKSLAAERLYDRKQRYRDFKAVFVTGGATGQQARRVLAQICRWGGFLAPAHVFTSKFGHGATVDPYATHVRAGAQELCQRILAVIGSEPPENLEKEE